MTIKSLCEDMEGFEAQLDTIIENPDSEDTKAFYKELASASEREKQTILRICAKATYLLLNHRPLAVLMNMTSAPRDGSKFKARVSDRYPVHNLRGKNVEVSYRNDDDDHLWTDGHWRYTNNDLDGWFALRGTAVTEDNSK